MNNLIIGKSQLVEIPILGTPAFGLQAFFNDVPNISKSNILLYGIETYSSDQMSIAPSGATIIDPGDVPLLSINLVTNKNEIIMENLPYYDLIRSNNGGFITLLNNFRIDLTKCNMFIAGAGSLAENQVGLVNLYYDLI